MLEVCHAICELNEYLRTEPSCIQLEWLFSSTLVNQDFGSAGSFRIKVSVRMGRHFVLSCLLGSEWVKRLRKINEVGK